MNSEEQSSFDHGKTVPFVWLAVIACITPTIVSGIAIGNIVIGSVDESPLMPIVSFIICSLMLVALREYYVECLGSTSVKINNTQYPWGVTLMLVLNYIWLSLPLAMLYETFFSWRFSVFQAVISFLFLACILPNLIIIPSIFKGKLALESSVLTNKKYKDRVKLIIISNILLIALCIFAIKKQPLVFSYIITVGLLTIWATLEYYKDGLPEKQKD